MSQPSSTSHSPEFAKHLVEQMAAAYASCHSYMDEGEATTVCIHKERGKQWTDTRPFCTAFVRPSAFRFEFRKRYGKELEWDRYIVWQSGESVQTWWSVRPGVETKLTLMLAIAGATGVSAGSSADISNLLMPNTVEFNGILSLTDLEMIGEEAVGSATAYKLQGNTPPYEGDGRLHQSKRTIWIDTRSLLILQIFTAHHFEDFVTETTTTYQPQMNITVPPDKLVFAAPV